MNLLRARDALASGTPWSDVGEGTPPKGDSVLADADLEEVAARLTLEQVPSLRVVEEDGRQIGTITPKSLATALLAQDRELRGKLAIADRMVAVGTLAAGLAHEINNPLTYVSANLELLQKALGTMPGESEAVRDAKALVGDIREGVRRVRDTVRDLRLFSKADDGSSAPIDVERVLEFALNLADNEIKHRAVLARDLAPLPPVQANEGQLGQVFLNLLLNAAQSIPEGAAHQHEIRVVTRTDYAGHAVIEIRDTGCGIPEQDHARIFEPFFTTKARHGSGLGLSICDGIVASLEGRIEVESREGKGSVFRVVLPAASGVPRPRSIAPESRAVAPRGRFLVIDDEQSIVRMLRRVLGADQTLACTSGAEALALLRRGARFDAILCDLLMPETTGMDLYDELMRSAPDQARRMVFMSGGTFTDRARAFLEKAPNPRLAKPFDTGQVLACMERLLASGRAEPSQRPQPRGGSGAPGGSKPPASA